MSWRRLPFVLALAGLLTVGVLAVAKAETDRATPAERTVAVDGREARLLLPRTLGDEPLPLVVLLHGFGSDAGGVDRYIGISRHVAHDRFALLLPQGNRNLFRARFWNATPTCCDFFGSDVDDAGYLRELVGEVERIVAVGRVSVIGYSNGGFMAYRLACDGLPKLAAIAVLAGSSFERAQRCDGADPLSVLHIHGDRDELVGYAGEAELLLDWPGFPGAVELAGRWARRADCAAAPDATRLDLDRRISGRETRVTAYDGCEGGIRVALWTIGDAGHRPAFVPGIGNRVLAWLLDPR